MVDKARLPVFYEILTAGFAVSVPSGKSVRMVLTTHIGLDAQYVEARIHTVFLNGRTVDDFDDATVAAGDVLALSSAMPGLVGAVFRRQSPLAKMRGPGISRAAFSEGRSSGEITLKLFNQVAKNLGPDFLTAGIRVSATYLRRFLAAHPELALKAIRVNEVKHDARDLPEILNVEACARLRVKPV